MCASARASIVLARSKPCSLDLEKLHVKDEESARTSTAGVVAVGEFGGDPEATLFAHDHELKSFGPAWDHAVEGETGFLVPLVGAIEQFSVGGPTGIVHGYGISGCRILFAGAFFDHF